MRYPAEVTARRHEQILDAGARLFREQGAGVSVAEVMAAAGLTHGGFYAHFGSKDALLVAAFERALGEMDGHIERAAASADPVEAFRKAYLSPEHRDAPGQGCAVAALGTEIARMPAAIREHAVARLDEIVDRMAELLTGAADPAGRAAALRGYATLVGAMVLARVAGPAMSDEVLAAVRER